MGWELTIDPKFTKMKTRKAPEKDKIPLEPSHWHLPVITFHTAFQKVKGWAGKLL
jgi:hypothetical protein